MAQVNQGSAPEELAKRTVVRNIGLVGARIWLSWHVLMCQLRMLIRMGIRVSRVERGIVPGGESWQGFLRGRRA